LALNQNKESRETVCSALELLYTMRHLSTDFSQLSLDSPDVCSIWHHLFCLIGGGFNVSASAAALKLSAVVLREMIDQLGSGDTLLETVSVSSWMEAVEERSDARQTATMRISSAHAVRVIADSIVAFNKSALSDRLRFVTWLFYYSYYSSRLY